LLEVNDLSIRFGGIVAIDSLTLGVESGQICSIIGPNGAGKTTFLNCITGVYRPTSGSIHFDGTDLRSVRPHALAPMGIARTFQNLALFPGMTVLDNVLTGRHATTRGGFVSAALRLPAVRRSEREARAFAESLLGQLGLADDADRPASDLPYGSQKRVELARALASEPRLLLLDEPAAGLVHAEVDTFTQELRALRDELGVTIVLVEHNMGMVMGISDHVSVLNFGRLIAEGPPAEVASDPTVIAAYLGSAAA
jgi:branched-chain amino acid transport system ATP-binding protein